MDVVTTPNNLPTEQTANEIVTQGSDRAKQLMQIVNKNQWSKDINGKNYLQVEAWQTLGKFYSYTAKTKSTEYVEMGPIKGFNAIVEILDKDGIVVGGAEAGCYTDEKKWATSQLFSLKSMAQTRATGKAFRQMLSWVAVLAGYEPTPAEEMDGILIESTNINLPTPIVPVASWKSEPSSLAQLDRLEQNLRNVAGTAGFNKTDFLKRHGVNPSEPLICSTVTKGQASTMIDETFKIMRGEQLPNVGYKSRKVSQEEINKMFDEQIEMEETN